MDTLRTKSAFSDKSDTAANRALIKAALTKSPLATSELLSVFIFNAQSARPDTSIYDTPIPIDFFDQARLQNLRLVAGTGRYAPAERRVPTDIMTDLGIYIVRNTVLLGRPDEASLPEIDQTELLRIVS